MASYNATNYTAISFGHQVSLHVIVMHKHTRVQQKSFRHTLAAGRHTPAADLKTFSYVFV